MMDIGPPLRSAGQPKESDGHTEAQDVKRSDGRDVRAKADREKPECSDPH